MTLRDRLSTSLEHRIVLDAAVPYPGDAARARLRASAAERPDWERVAGVAEKAKVLPLVVRNLQDLGGDLLPEAARGHLRARAEAFARHNLLRSAELVRLVRRLAGHDVRAVPFKGPVLAQTLYGNLALRQFSDLDVLVPQVSFGKAVPLLQEDGYVQDRPAQVFTPAQLEAVLRHFDEYNFRFVHPARKVVLELHWRLLRGDPVTGLAPGATVEVELGGARLPTLAPEVLIRYLCLHGSKDDWRRLSWICDVAAFLHVHADLDWDAVWAAAARDGSATRLCLGLYLAHHLLHSPLPEVMQRHLAHRREQMAYLSGFCRVFDPEVTPPLPMYLRYHWGLRERLRDRLAFLRAFVFSPKYYSIPGRALPGRWFFLYGWRRSWHLLSRYVFRLSRKP